MTSRWLACDTLWEPEKETAALSFHNIAAGFFFRASLYSERNGRDSRAVVLRLACSRAFVVRAQSVDSRLYGHTLARFNWHAYWNSISEITDSNCSVWRNIARSSVSSQQAGERQTRIKLASCSRGCGKASTVLRSGPGAASVQSQSSGILNVGWHRNAS
ncbi:unnamed protein product [Xylocopa violacea]|uniref:Uncharacterized protein n=1 Tax=Xylocopa violacea TaxID=135666 RepID=A0ABP1N3G4_XYLVO